MKLFKRIFFATLSLFILSVVLFYTVKPHKRVILSAEDMQCLNDTCCLETRIIKLPGFKKAYNPSLIPYKAGYLLSFRVDSFDFLSKIKHLLNHRVAYLGLAVLDRQFNVVGMPQLLDMTNKDSRKMSTPQDARLYRFQEKNYLFFNDYVLEEKGSQEMFVAQIVENEGGFILHDSKHLHYAQSMQRVEKNWSPFTYEDKLYVVYRIKPLTTLEVDLDSGECTKVEESHLGFAWNFGENRGGTPCYLLGDEYLSFFHSSKNGEPTFFRKSGGRAFYMGAYTFESTPPFSLKKVSSCPLGCLEDYESDNYEKIVYPAGLVVEDNRLLVAWGKNDRMICLSVFDREKLLSSLTRVSSSQ